MARVRGLADSPKEAFLQALPLANPKGGVMPYEMKPLPCDPTAITGMSERLIRSHYDNNYGSTVQRLNAITGQLAELEFANAPIFVINGLRLNLPQPSRASSLCGHPVHRLPSQFRYPLVGDREHCPVDFRITNRGYLIA